MAKRSKSEISGIVEEVDYTVSSDALDNPADISYTDVEQSIKIVNKFPAKLVVRGQVTGKLYTWSEAGSVVEVAEEDVAGLLTKKIGEAACCGSNQRGNVVFEVV